MPACNPESSIDMVNRDLAKLTGGYRGCKLSPNYTKMKALTFHPGTNFRLASNQIVINGNVNEQVTHSKIRVVVLNATLFTAHMQLV